MSMAHSPPPAGPEGQQPPERKRGWLSRIAPGVRNAFSKRETPENLWVKCPGTGEMLYRPDLDAALWVTPAGYHMRIGAKQRFAYTFDDGAFERIPSPHAIDDPLHFTDQKPYAERLAAARKSTGEKDSMAIAVGAIGGLETVVIVQDFTFMGGSLGAGAGEAFLAAADEAVRREAPLVIFTASGGARMQEGTLSLMQMARTTIAVQKVKAAGLPYVVVLTDPTTGGVLASYAMLGDVHIAEPGALIGFSGRRVIEQTIRETLPPGFQTSEFLVERGMVDKLATRAEIPAVLGRVLKTLMLGRERRHAA
jgi:acetyl-CoA carboxylase carboxyl transferase subunit beta